MTITVKTNRIRQVRNDLVDTGIEFGEENGVLILPDKMLAKSLFDFLEDYNNGIVKVDWYTQEITMTFTNSYRVTWKHTREIYADQVEVVKATSEEQAIELGKSQAEKAGMSFSFINGYNPETVKVALLYPLIEKTTCPKDGSK